MRQDVYERMKYIKKQRVKPKFAAVARQYGCDYRTVKRAYERACTAQIWGSASAASGHPFGMILPKSLPKRL